jgi:hypothetical protein
VTARPISIRWISDVPSKMVKIFTQGQSHRHTRAGLPIAVRMGYRCPFRGRARVPAAQVTARYAC